MHRHWQNRHRTPYAVAKSARKKAAPPATRLHLRLGAPCAPKKKSPTLHFSPIFRDNKAVQPCLALPADNRRAISFDTPTALAKFAEQKKTELSSEHYEWLQWAVASRR